MSSEVQVNDNADLQQQLSQARAELEVLRQQQTFNQSTLQDKFIETLFDKGGTIFIEYSKMSQQVRKRKLEFQPNWNERR